jgi:hypothetical protein
MNNALILCGLVGSVMVVVGLARIVPELAIDSPLDLLLCFITRRGGSDFFTLVHAHITEGWPETKIDAVLLYGGLACLGFTLLIYFLKSYFAQLT